MTRYKSAAENAEKVEDELKAEKRKLQREARCFWKLDSSGSRVQANCDSPLVQQLRTALDKIEELESSNSHLNKRLEKMKSSRGMAQTP